MKMRYMKVSSDKGLGAVYYIILQIEDTDEFFKKTYLRSGYKIIIECNGKRVAAAGGYEFNPYYETSVKECSLKITTNESDILGFYLNQVKDIDELPDEIDADKFWNVIYSSRGKNYSIRSRIDEMYDDGTLDIDKKYYKLLYRFRKDVNIFEEAISAVNSLKLRNIDNAKTYADLSDFLEKQNEKNNNLENKFRTSSYEPSYNLSIIDAQTNEEVSKTFSTGIEQQKADYLWCQFEELPEDKWNQFNKFGFYEKAEF